MNKGTIIGLSVGGAAVLAAVVLVVMNKSKKDSDSKSAGGQMSYSPPIASAPPTSSAPQPDPEPAAPRFPDTTGDKKATISKWKNYKSEIKPVCGRRRIMGKKKIAWFDCVGSYSGFSGFDGMSDKIEVSEVLTDI